METPLFKKSKAFALRTIKLYKWLTQEKKEFILSKQVIRSGTSIGANIAEAQGGVTRPDFINKYHISLKECKETIYWLQLLHQADYIDQKMFSSINDDAIELEKLLTASLKTLKAKNK